MRRAWACVGGQVREDLAAFFCCSARDVVLEVEAGDVEDSLPLAGVGVEAQPVTQLHVRVTQRPKPFLGGYRDSASGLEFHHAESQTGPPPRVSPKASRDAQTVRTRRRRAHTGESKATQVTHFSTATT